MSYDNYLKKAHIKPEYSRARSQIELIKNIDSILPKKLKKSEDLAWEYGLAYHFQVEDQLDIFKTLKEEPKFDFNFLIDITALDWMDSRESRFQVVYQLLSLKHLHRVCLKVSLDEDSAEVESLVSLWASASFLEREVYDMYGIKFKNHPDLRRILMYDEFVGFPLRKDYPLKGKQPRVKLRIPELRNTSEDMQREPLVSINRKRV